MSRNINDYSCGDHYCNCFAVDIMDYRATIEQLEKEKATLEHSLNTVTYIEIADTSLGDLIVKKESSGYWAGNKQSLIGRNFATVSGAITAISETLKVIESEKSK